MISVHLSDVHFGAFDPKIQYNILEEQFLSKIYSMMFLDIISIDGDLFDKKFMGNSEPVLYANKFVDDLVQIARQKGCTIICLKGTPSHDDNMLQLYYHYMEDPTVDFRVIESIQFTDVKGCRILCIPELHSIDESIYKEVFYGSGWYDEAFIHGTYKGASIARPTERVLEPKDFIYLTGPAIAGHVHNGGCFNGFFYYNGCPYRWKFGEEEDKGFLVVVHDLDSGLYWTQFEKIESFRYITIYLDELVSNDPKIIIENINRMKQEQAIDYIKIRFRCKVDGGNKTIINNYYRNNPTTKIEFMDVEEAEEQRKIELEQKEEKYSYLTDSSISDLEKLVRYINETEGSEFITAQKLTELLSDL